MEKFSETIDWSWHLCQQVVWFYT